MRLNNISQLGIIGAGTMGSSIAVAISKLGLPIKIIDSNVSALENGLQRIDHIFDRLKTKQQKDKEEQTLDIKSRRLLIEPVNSYQEFSDIDLIIEATNEDIEIKKIVLETLDKICHSKTIFASNTSSFSITQLGSFTKRSKQVIGMHFFNPAHIMPLVEVIPGLNTQPNTTDTIIELVRALDKSPVKVQDCASFLANRLLSRYINEAIWALQLGLADVKTIDSSAVEMLMPIGPLQLRDMNGLDIGLSVAHFNCTEYGERFKPAPLLEKMVKQKLLGKKTKAGFYIYNEDKRKPQTINPMIEELINSTKNDSSQNTNNLPPFEPIQLFLPMINEVFFLLQEKIVSVKDIDPALKAGLGMKKGILEFAIEFGLDNCLIKIEKLNKVYGERFRPAPLLKRYIWAGKKSF